MKRFPHILLILASAFVFYGKACDEDSEIQDISDTRHHIMNDFSASNLSEQKLKDYEEIACQKLSDMADYINIVSDSTRSFVFRQKAAGIIREMMHENDIHVNVRNGANNLTLMQWLEQSPGIRPEIPRVLFDSIRILSPWTRMDDHTYTGRMVFEQKYLSLSLNDTVLINKVVRSTEIYAMHIEKVFGSDTLQVWRVFLGNIELEVLP